MPACCLPDLGDVRILGLARPVASPSQIPALRSVRLIPDGAFLEKPLSSGLWGAAGVLRAEFWAQKKTIPAVVDLTHRSIRETAHCEEQLTPGENFPDAPRLTKRD